MALESLLNNTKDRDQRLRNFEFVAMVESHVQYFKDPDNHRLETIKPIDGNVWIGDLFGLFDFMGVDKNIHYLAMRINDYLCPSDYEGDKLDFIIPDPTKFMRISNTFYSSDR